MANSLAQIVGIPTPGPNEPLRGFKFWTGGLDTNYNVLLGPIVSQVLLYAIVIAGLIFFAKLIMAGFGFLTSAGDSGKIAAATKNLTNAAIGLFVVFVTFFVIQIIQVVFGVSILWP